MEIFDDYKIKIAKYLHKQIEENIDEDFRNSAQEVAPMGKNEDINEWLNRLIIFLGKKYTEKQEGNSDNYEPEIIEDNVKFNNFIDSEISEIK